MIRKKLTIFYSILLIITCASIAGAAPQVSFAPVSEISPGAAIDIPIRISGTSGSSIGGYALRIDYDDTVLKFIETVEAGTLSEGNPNFKWKIPTDGIGNLAVGIGFDFTAQDGTLILLRFSVSGDFCDNSTTLAFAGKNGKSVLFTAGFDKIESVFTDFSYTALPCRTETVPPKPEATDSHIWPDVGNSDVPDTEIREPASSIPPESGNSDEYGNPPDSKENLPEEAQSCFSTDENLSLNLCGEYMGNLYGFTMEYYPNLPESGSIFWQMNADSLSLLSDNPGNCVRFGHDLSFHACFRVADEDYYLYLEYEPPEDCPDALCWKTGTVTQNCFPMKEDFSLDICAVYQGSGYDVSLDYMSVYDNNSGFYWKTVPFRIHPVPAERENCIPLADDLSLHLCVRFGEIPYLFTLDYAGYEDDFQEAYWKMDMETLIPAD